MKYLGRFFYCVPFILLFLFAGTEIGFYLATKAFLAAGSIISIAVMCFVIASSLSDEDK